MIVQQDRPKMTIWRMRFTCGCLRPETHTHNIQQLLLFGGNSSSFTWWIRYELYIGPRVMCPSLALPCDFLILQAATQLIQQTRSSQNSLNIVSRGARYPGPWQDNRTNCTKSEFGPVKTEAQSPPPDTTVSSIHLLSSVPSFQTPTLQLRWCIILVKVLQNASNPKSNMDLPVTIHKTDQNIAAFSLPVQ
jgi:hypothetical protein